MTWPRKVAQWLGTFLMAYASQSKLEGWVDDPTLPPEVVVFVMEDSINIGPLMVGMGVTYQKVHGYPPIDLSEYVMLRTKDANQSVH